MWGFQVINSGRVGVLRGEESGSEGVRRIPLEDEGG